MVASVLFPASKGAGGVVWWGKVPSGGTNSENLT